MKDLEQNPWKTLSTKEVYNNAWIQIKHNEVINPGGGKGIYGLVHFHNIAVGILPLDKEYNTWIVGQYRYALGQYSWEMPEGGSLLEDNPLDSAKRELKEEAGIVAQKWTKLMDFYTSNSVTDEYAVCYIAQGLTFEEAEPEETEDLLVRKLPFKELFDMTMRGEIKDSLTVAAVLKTQFLILDGKI